MKVLALECSTDMGSVALMDGVNLVEEISYRASESHSIRLMPTVDRLLKDCGLTPQGLQGLAVGLGPGSFTGIRIALSTAKGLSIVLGIPIVGLCSLLALVEAARHWPGQICAIVNPKKGRAFTARYRFTPQGGIECLEEPAIRGVTKWIDSLKGEALFTGNGIDQYMDEIMTKRKGQSHIAEPELRFPRASIIARMAVGGIQRGGDDVDKLAPLYVKEEGTFTTQRISGPNGSEHPGAPRKQRHA